MITWKDFTKRYGTSITSNIQLTEWAKQLKIPNFSCIIRDELQSLPPGDHNIIINLQTEDEEGSHWDALHTKGNTAYYFSSYALPPLKEVKDFTDSYKNRKHNTLSLQDQQEYCGQMALYVLYHLSQGKDFLDIILSLFKKDEPNQENKTKSQRNIRK